MLTSFTIGNFRSYREATLEIAPLTVLIGANASGKSNALEALRLFSWIARGNKLGSIRHALQEDDSAIRGAARDLGFRGESVFSLSCRTTHPEWDRYSIELERREDDELHISGEELGGTGISVPLFEIVAHDKETGAVRVAYDNFKRGGKKPLTPCDDQEAVLSQLQNPARFRLHHDKAQKIIPEVIRLYRQWLSNVFFLDARPSAMRSYSFKTDRTLKENGSNLSGVLYNLSRTPDTGRRILEFVEALPEQDIREVGFIETPRGEVMIELTESFGGAGRTYDASLLSDGTLRVLAIAAAVLSAPEGSLVVIEEIDNGVHPGRAEALLERLSAVAGERGLRILLSSHNPALLDALPRAAVPNAVVCYRDPKDGSSRLTRLSDVADYPALVAQGPVGQLATRGIIEQYVKDDRSPEERKKQALEWLSDLREQVG